MPVISHIIKKAINHCLVHDVAFAAYRLPGDEVRFVAAKDIIGAKQYDGSFTITLWNCLSGTSVCIQNSATDSHANYTFPDYFYPSTDEKVYKQSLSDLIASLKIRGGKTVISRVISGECDSIDWAEVADRLFDSYHNSFCHIYYHPVTGAWLGATPEVLVCSEKHGRAISTMALAGTKPVNAAWDDKNYKEQQMVTDFIIERLHPLCNVIEVAEVADLNYGSLSHLCTQIHGNREENISHSDLCDALSPTPAVAGLPKEIALAEISKIESHQRLCYGGYVTVENDDKSSIISYVNLRCVHFSRSRFNIYAGGGITAQSNSDQEWEETEAKAKTIKDIIYSLGNARTKS